MTTMRLAFPLILTTMARCGHDKDTQSGDLLVQFLEARCRLLVEGACIDSQDRSCGNTLSYRSLDGCVAAELDVMGDCARLVESAFAAIYDVVNLCVEKMATLDCLSDDVCTDGAPVYNAGPCADVQTLIEESCT